MPEVDEIIEDKNQEPIEDLIKEPSAPIPFSDIRKQQNVIQDKFYELSELRLSTLFVNLVKNATLEWEGNNGKQFATLKSQELGDFKILLANTIDPVTNFASVWGLVTGTGFFQAGFNIFDGTSKFFGISQDDGNSLPLAARSDLDFLPFSGNLVDIGTPTLPWDNIHANQYHAGTATGASGTFTTADAKTVTVVGGIITSIV